MKQDTLPPKLQKVADRIAADLKRARNEGTVYPGKEITGKVLAERYSVFFHESYTDADMREVVNYRRRVYHDPIGSTPKASEEKGGYFYASSLDELSHTIAHLTSRLEKQNGALNGLKHAFDPATPELF
jgi:hypothetical protein